MQAFADATTLRFAVESAKRTKRSLQYKKAVFPRASYGLGAVAPSSSGRLVFTFDKIALAKGQVFRVYFYEKGVPTIKSATFLRFIFKNFGDKVRLARTFLAFNQA